MAINYKTYNYSKEFTIGEIAKLWCGIDKYESIPPDQFSQVRGVAALILSGVIEQQINIGRIDGHVDIDRRMITENILPRGSSKVWNITLFKREDLYELAKNVGLPIPEELNKLIGKKNKGTGEPPSTIIKDEYNCQQWLVGLMSNNSTPDKKKEQYLSEAKQQYKVGTRAFNRAWANAIVKTDNTNWGKPGRKKSRL